MESLQEAGGSVARPDQTSEKDKLEEKILNMAESMNSLNSTILNLNAQFNNKIGTLESQMLRLESGMSEIRNPDPEISFNLQREQNRAPVHVQSLSNGNTNQNFGDSFSANMKIKPQEYDGTTDIGEYLTQFNIFAEINGWSGQSKALYLATCLTGNARSLLSELSELQKRDFEMLTDVLRTRFGTRNKCEIFRSQLKSLRKEKGQSISDLAQKVKTLTRQAYPDANMDLLEILALDYFIDSLDDGDIRLRLRECCPKTMGEAETIAVRLETYKLADQQRNQSEKVCRTFDSGFGQSSQKFDSLVDRLDSLSNKVEKLTNDNFERSRPRFRQNNDQFRGRHDSRFQGNNPRFQGNRQRFQSNGPRFEGNGQRYENNGQRFGSDGHRFGNNGQRYENNGQRYESNGQRQESNGQGFQGNGQRWQGNGQRSSWGATARPRQN